MKTMRPSLERVSGFFKKKPWHLTSMESTFSAIYRRNTWKDPQSVSGSGSTLFQTQAIRKGLPSLVAAIGGRSILDIPCGDFNWMKEVTFDVDVYIGADIVEEMIQLNTEKYGNDRRTFVKLDITKDELPTVDLVLCRECFVHFSFHDVFLALNNLKRSHSRYLLTTTFTSLEENEDILTGEWRPINLERPPFSLPEPVRIINERCPVEGYSDKSLGLWRVSDLQKWSSVRCH